MAGKNKGKNKNLTGGTVAVNRRARFDYEILETIEAGLMLMGTEVKSLRISGASLNEAYAGIKDGSFTSSTSISRNIRTRPRPSSTSPSACESCWSTRRSGTS